MATSGSANGSSNEKDFSNSETGTMNGANDHDRVYLGKDTRPEVALEQIRKTGSISISPELFEKIYLTPENTVKGDLRKTFANPTPLALLGLVMALTPFSCDIMGWRGAGGNGAASTGSYYFMGGLLMIIGGVGEWILGNTFPFLVFCGYGGFWLSFASTLTPGIGAYGHYAPTYSSTNPSAGLDTAPFAASFAFFLLAMGFLSLLFAICTLRTNICLAFIEWCLTIVFSLLAATFWQLAKGNAVVAGKCEIAAGAFGFVASAAGWWILFAQLLASVDFPIQLPVGDLGGIIKGASEKRDGGV